VTGSTINPAQLHDVNIRAAEAGEQRRTGNLGGSNQVDPVESYCNTERRMSQIRN